MDVCMDLLSLSLSLSEWMADEGCGGYGNRRGRAKVRERMARLWIGEQFKMGRLVVVAFEVGYEKLRQILAYIFSSSLNTHAHAHVNQSNSRKESKSRSLYTPLLLLLGCEPSLGRKETATNGRRGNGFFCSYTPMASTRK